MLRERPGDLAVGGDRHERQERQGACKRPPRASAEALEREDGRHPQKTRLGERSGQLVRRRLRQPAVRADHANGKVSANFGKEGRDPRKHCQRPECGTLCDRKEAVAPVH